MGEMGKFEQEKFKPAITTSCMSDRLRGGFHSSAENLY